MVVRRVEFWVTVKNPCRHLPNLPWLTGLGGQMGEMKVKFPSLFAWKEARWVDPDEIVRLMLN
jgi:hypothetical protein